MTHAFCGPRVRVARWAVGARSAAFNRSRGAVAAARLASLALAGCHRSEEGVQPSAARDTVAPRVTPAVRFTKVVAKPLPQTLDISGTLAADETSEVATQVAGAVVKVAVDVGSRVKKGDP